MLDRRTILELLTYTAASGAALVVDVSVLTALVSGAGWPYLAATATSFVVGGVFLYFVSIAFVFRIRRIPNPVIELPLFLALGLIGLLVSMGVMYVAVGKFHLHYLIAKGGAAVCTFTINFLLRRSLMFSRVAHSLGTAEPSDA